MPEPQLASLLRGRRCVPMRLRTAAMAMLLSGALYGCASQTAVLPTPTLSQGAAQSVPATLTATGLMTPPTILPTQIPSSASPTLSPTSAPPTPYPTAATGGIVAADSVVLSEPSLSQGTAVGRVQAGTAVELWLRDPAQHWFQIHTAAGLNGWLPATALQIDPKIAEQVPEGTIDLPDQTAVP